jgi:hypothetical protein
VQEKTSGEEAAWYLDLKNKGEVGQGSAPAGDKADGESTDLQLAAHEQTLSVGLAGNELGKVAIGEGEGHY